ncbi:MAG: D-glycero-beta-D-manno-heptose 1,7-bisphosphate 7-phosphatase [Chromatiales bacterium]|nr:D-glycero-beta-D-manno-heptose 1,7-bisphosphate 7-phosphatase [Chromatiales bacterium]
MPINPRLIILDRDGVINEDSDAYIKSPEEWIPIPGSLEAIARLNRAGYRIAVATNQSGIARGMYDLATLGQIHQKMHQALQQVGGKVEAVFYCPDGPDEGSHCRKPRPGMFYEIARRFDTDLSGVPAVGDSLRDLQAAVAVGALPVLVRTGKGERTLAKGEGIAGVSIFDSLADFTDHLLAQEGTLH